tara:strand:- start:263 stop:520 length:258 start_codon:yes stop_codon:yes gene_type:complete
MDNQLELFPDLYPDQWVCEICDEDTHEVDYDYIGSGYNHLECELKEDKWKVEQYNRNRNIEDYITSSEEIKQEWPGLDAINKEWV